MSTSYATEEGSQALALIDSLEGATPKAKAAVADCLYEVEHFTRTVSMILTGLASKTRDEENAQDLVTAAQSVDHLTHWIALQAAAIAGSLRASWAGQQATLH